MKEKRSKLFSVEYKFCWLSDLVRPKEVHSGRNPEAGRNPAICSSYRTAVRNERENLRIAVGFGPAAGSSFRTKSGSRTQSGHLQFIPALFLRRSNSHLRTSRLIQTFGITSGYLFVHPVYGVTLDSTKAKFSECTTPITSWFKDISYYNRVVIYR